MFFGNSGWCDKILVMSSEVIDMRRERLSWIGAIGAGAGLVVASLYMPGGDDLYRYYLPFAQGCLDCGFIPYFAQWFLAPLRYFPDYPSTWFLWTFVSVVGFITLAHSTGSNPLFLLISFPMLGQVWLGQVDILVAVGLVVFLSGKNLHWRGVGMILALSKPQLTVFPILVCLFLDSPRDLLKMLAVPVGAIFISLYAFGWDWWLQWFDNAVNGLPIHVWRLASLDVWKFGIILAPFPFLFQNQRKRLTAGLLVAALGTPFFGVYSYVLFLLFEVRWWSALLSYLWLGAFIFWQESAMRLAWILPLGLLLNLAYLEFAHRHEAESKRP